MEKKTFTSGRDFLSPGYVPGQENVTDTTTTKPDISGAPKISEAPEVPTTSEFQEAFTPDLSEYKFKINGIDFVIKVSNIRLQKQISKAAITLTDLLKKINIPQLIKAFREAVQETEDEYVDFINFIMDILYQIGPDVLMEKLFDLYIDIVHLILSQQNAIATRDWVEDNLNFYQLQMIFFTQMKKDRIQGKIVSFLAVATRLLIGEKNGSDSRSI